MFLFTLLTAHLLDYLLGSHRSLYRHLHRLDILSRLVLLLRHHGAQD